MEIISDVRMRIVKADHDPHRLRDVLRHHRVQDFGLHYTVEGTMSQVERLVESLRGPGGPEGVQPVPVSRPLMEYIQQRYGDRLGQMCGDGVLMETEPDVPAGRGTPGGTLRVTFRPRPDSSDPLAASRCLAVRRRFVTFYQRTASDVQTVSVRLGPGQQAALQQRFPRLLFQPGATGQDAAAMGPFASVQRMKESLPGPARTTSRNRAPPAQSHRQKPEEDICAICMDVMAAGDKETLRCRHSFCKDCLKTAFAYKPVCPTCGQVYGVLKGTQPAGGAMTVSRSSAPLPGYERYGTIVIHYLIPGGVQTDEHPSPGRPFQGVSRTAFLPDSPGGRAVLDLLRRAFDQRLTFTVGRSTTSGRNHVITWNDIHHKTATHGGATSYGYPDPDYLRRVRDELKAKGIE